MVPPDAWLAAAGVLAAVYVLPLYAPPPSAPGIHGDSLWARLYPDVPLWWTFARLAALGAAAMVALVGLRRLPRTMTEETKGAELKRYHPRLLQLAATIAGTLAVVAFFISAGSRSQQLVFLMLLPFPAILAWSAGATRRATQPSAGAWCSLAIVSGWTAMVAVVAPGDTRAANLVDHWEFINYLGAFAASDLGYLGSQRIPGESNLSYLIIGGPILRLSDIEPNPSTTAAIAAAYTVIAAVGVHRLAAKVAGGWAAPVAVAAFLFAPATLGVQLSPTPLAFVIAHGIWMFVAFFEWMRNHSLAGLVWLALLGGLAAGFAIVAVPAVCLAVPTAITLGARLRGLPLAGVATAAGLGIAAAVPVLPPLSAFQEANSTYGRANTPWLILEEVLQGQRHYWDLLTILPDNPDLPERHLDIAVATALAPWVTRRNSLRLWGDVFLEPIAAVFAALAIVTWFVRRGPPGSGLVLAMVAASLVGASASSYDTPSIARAFPLIPAAAVLAACGLVVIAQALREQRRAACVVLLAVVASGSHLFYFVNPTILADSWVRIAIDATRSPSHRAALVSYPTLPGFDSSQILHEARIASVLSRRTLPVLGLPMEFRADDPSLPPVRRQGGELDPLVNETGRPAADVMLWSPAFAKVVDVAGALREIAPSVRIVEMRDAAGRSTAWAGAFAADWKPSLPAHRWHEVD